MLVQVSANNESTADTIHVYNVAELVSEHPMHNKFQLKTFHLKKKVLSMLL